MKTYTADQQVPSHNIIEILKDEATLIEEDEIILKFQKRARKIGADGLILQVPVHVGAEIVPFGGIRQTYLFKAHAVRFDGQTAASTLP